MLKYKRQSTDTDGQQPPAKSVFHYLARGFFLVKTEITIIEVPIAQLKPAEYNPRKWSPKAIEDLKASITAFGLVDPIIANSAAERKNIVIGGHFRLHVAKLLGYTSAPVVYVNIPEIKTEQELNIRLNKNSGEWDFDLLANFDDDILKIAGFESEDLDKIFKLETSEEDDAVPAVPEIPKSKLGDIYQLGDHRIMCGDSTKKEDVEKLMDGKKADMVFTDPPYGLGGYAGRSGKFEGIKGDADKDFMKYYYCIPQVKERYIWGTYQVLMKLSEIPKDVIVWKKNSFGMGKGYRGQYELCFYYGSFSGSDSDVWEIKKDTNYNHPTQKPVALPERAIQNSSKRGGIVLDLFTGGAVQ
jgi:hypothetical protein